MDCRAVGSAGHDSAEGINLAHEVTLPHAADRRVARHAAEVVTAVGCERHAAPASSCGGGGFDPGVACPNDQNVKHGNAVAFPRH
jgi:hypothetical protein